MMGGGIDIQSEPNEGSTFTVKFLASLDRPPSEAPERPSVAKFAAAPQNGSNTVLVIDDDPAVHDLLEHSLTREGFSVITASRGDEGIDLARRVKPFAITLDVIMPNKDGWAVLKELKSDPGLAAIPVIMISIMDDKKLGFALGATEYLTKPVDHKRLIDLLHKYRPGDRQGHALVVEDDGETRELFARSLKKEGWSVGEAENGREALERVEEQRPDVILLDLMMPVMDGFQFVMELRKRKDIPFIPVVVVTAKDLTREDFSRIEGNVQKVLQKGAFARDELLREIRNIIKGISRPPGKRGG
jgi:CheY-like chemotaxis protein